MGSFPRHLNGDQLEALPIGPFVEKRRPITEEDRAAGMRGAYVITTELPGMIATHYLPDDPLFWIDRNGESWRFGQWASGEWFKEPFSI